MSPEAPHTPTAAADPTASAPAPTALPAAPPTAAQQALANRNAWLWLGLVAFTLLSLLGNLLLWGRLSNMQHNLAERSVQAQNTASEAKNLSQGMSERVDSNQAKIALLDAKLQDMAALNKQVEGILQQATRTQNANLLTDLESSLRLAEQQAQLTRNVQPLIDALLQAQNRLEQAGDGAVLLKPAQNAIDKDLAKLKSANYPDIAAAVDGLDQLIAELDQLPLWVEQSAEKTTATPPTQAKTAAPSPAQAAWQQQWHSAWGGLKGLVAVERMDGANTAAITQSQAALLREQIRLYAVSARTAVLSGRLQSAQQSLKQLQKRLPHYFDSNSATYARVQRQLTAVHASLSGSEQSPQAQHSIEAIALLNERMSAIPLSSSLPSSPIEGAPRQRPLLP